ncbi:MAG: Holliday junction branch migration protein RuvA, partial [Limnoraphis sp.]
MIGYLKGTVVAIQKNNSNRVILLLETNNIGYEVQIVPRMIAQLPTMGESIQVFTHLQVREDQMVLYGFSSFAERDLFRQLVSVSGIGTQLAIALLNTLELTELVQAIVGENTKVLAKTPGVGTKTAQRIALELKTK